MTAETKVPGRRLPEESGEGLIKRILWLYGLYMVLHQLMFLIGYFWLPEGFLRGGPWFRIGEWAAVSGFSGQFLRTVTMNLGLVCGLCVLLNLQRVRDFSLGYSVPIAAGVISGLTLGTNSFAAMDLEGLPFLAGTAGGLVRGGAEMFGYVLVVAATVRIGVFRRVTWTRWRERFIKVGRLRDVRLRTSEWITLLAGIGLILSGAWKESL